MKKFFEEYGFLLVSALVVVMLIGITTVVGPKISESTNTLSSSFANMGDDWAKQAEKITQDLIDDDNKNPAVKYLYAELMPGGFAWSGLLPDNDSELKYNSFTRVYEQLSLEEANTLISEEYNHNPSNGWYAYYSTDEAGGYNSWTRCDNYMLNACPGLE